MVYHWQSLNTKVSGVDDMTLLSKINDESIVENLKKRFMDDWIFTYIGPVLISVNPFKQLPYFGEKEIFSYQGAAQYENRPHIYSTADNMYRNMMIDTENQCVIISGESGAGKTVAAKYVMNYISKVSGGGNLVQHIKDVILESNPLLEAFGNAKTVRNNNSSRFGKYVEMVFGLGGQPVGGKISNFLLEKSRVVSISSLERSFHIFYQLCLGANEPLRSELALIQPNNFCYLSQSPCMTVDDTNDATDFRETVNAMSVIGMNDPEQREIFKIVAAVLHLGNIQFHESDNYASITNPRALECPAALLEIDPYLLGQKLVSRVLEGKWGRQAENVEMTLGLEQSLYTRDALSKALYARLFDFLVQRINQAMVTSSQGYTIGILDIYGFEIFQQNGFDQMVINYVNEKLQQIFIELTLKAEQEEYVQEGIRWTPVDYFNNQIVCELIEGTRPPGIFAIVNDVCATLHNVTANADSDLQKKLGKEVSGHQHFQTSAEGFVIHHYAGIVHYDVHGFCDRNRDVLFPDLIMMMQSSRSNFIRSLFPEQVENKSTRPTTVGTKIKSQASQLVASLMKCSPHYIRCIKPNETKRPRDWEEDRVRHQVEYLGLKENVRVRRAGFAYRRLFQKFLQRYAILCNETWPVWRGAPQEGIERIMAASYVDRDQYQLGKSKIFIKAPESLFQLEELRERKFDGYARIIQRAFHKYFDKRQRQRQQEQASAIVFGKKQRRKYSINRVFVGDYIGLDHRPELLSLVGRREKVEFCETVNKYDRRFKGVKRDIFITTHRVLLVGREKLKQGPQKGLVVPVIKRDIQYPDIIKVSLSTRQDDLLIVHVRGTYDTVIESTFKTEFLTVLSKKYKATAQQDLPIVFSDSMEFTVKKQGWGGGGTRKIRVVVGTSDLPVLKVSGKVLTIEVGEGLPKNTYPRALNNDYNNGQVRKPAKPARGPGVVPVQTRPTPFNQNQYNNNSGYPPQTGHSANNNNHTSTPTGGLQSRPITLRQPPPPPSEPAPANQPRIPAGAFRLPTTAPENNSGVIANRFKPKGNSAPNNNSTPTPAQNGVTNNFQARSTATTGNGIAQKMNQLQSNFTPQQNMAEILKTPASGASGAQRTSINSKPAPGAGRPKPKPKPVAKLPKCTALYDYDARDIDELSLKEGDLLEIVKEHDSGWWLGKLQGKEGLFPSNYVSKL